MTTETRQPDPETVRSTEPERPTGPRPEREELLEQYGSDDLTIQSLFQFCFVPPGRLGLLKELALDEDWGDKEYVLLRYLAVYVRLALEQGRYVWNDEQIVMAAGRLSTANGAPLYLGMVRNASPDANPWVMNWVGERPSTAELPGPADLGEWPALDPGSEVLVAADLTDPERRVKLPGMEGLPPVTQIAAVTGAAHWALHRGLAVRQIHSGGRGYFLPIYLRDRDDLTMAPDLAVPVVPQGDRLIVRTVLEPHAVYAPARCVVERGDQLPAWLLESWDASREHSRDDEGEG